MLERKKEQFVNSREGGGGGGLNSSDLCIFIY